MVQLFPCGLDITAVSATDLAKRKRFGSQDPYLLFHLQGRRKFTNVAVKGGSKPEWNQTIRYRRVNNPTSKEDTILKVYCFHEKTGVSIMSTDGLIGQCEVDLQETVFKSQDGSFEGVLSLQNDGKASGKVKIRLRLCEASDEPETAETAPIRPDRKGVHLFGSKDKDKDNKSAKHAKSQSTSSMGAIAHLPGSRPGQTDQVGGDSKAGGMAAAAGRMYRPKSMENMNTSPNHIKSKIKFQDPLRTLHGTQSMDEVRALSNVTPVSEADSSFANEGIGDHSNNTSTASVERSPEPPNVGSPPQRFISQDDDGNVNQLRLLTAPFDPSMLQPTPPTLRRALSAQYFYDQMQPHGHHYQHQQQPEHQPYPSMAEPYQRPMSQQAYYPGYNPDAFFNSGAPGSHAYNSMLALGPPIPGQQQEQLQQSQSYPMMASQRSSGQQYPDPAGQTQQQQQTSPGFRLPPMPQAQAPRLPQQTIPGPVPYQPHTVFQPRQPNRPRMDNFELNKHASLPSRNVDPGRFPDPATMGPSALSPTTQQQQQQSSSRTGPMPSATLQYGGGGGAVGGMGGVGPAEAASTMAVAAAISAAAAAAAPTVAPKTPDADTLGPSGGNMPEAYSYQNQQRLASMIPPSAAPDDANNYTPFSGGYQPLTSPSEAAAALGGGSSGVGSHTLHRPHLSLHAPSAPPVPTVSIPTSTLTGVEPTARSASVGPSFQHGASHGNAYIHHARDDTQIMYSSPTAIDQNAIPTRPVSRATNNRELGTATAMSMASNNSHSHWESLDTMTSSPAIPVPTRIPEQARDAIIAQFKPMAIPWDGRDIQASAVDSALGRSILDRYTTGTFREKHVREGLWVNRHRSPTMAMQQLSLQHHSTEGNTGEGNDRVILKYARARKEWEIDNILVRYLVNTQVNDALENHFSDYPRQHFQKQQSYEVSPFIVGLYEAFLHPLTSGPDTNECRYLSVFQWYPETLQDYILDCNASGEGLTVTLPVVRTLIECVCWIHDHKICHLNLKPSNFARDPFAASRLLPDGAGWKLIDFESARVMGEEKVGRCTFAYASPEILRGHLSDVPVISQGTMDVWSLGLVIYELLTDQPLFHTDAQAQDAILQASPSQQQQQPPGHLLKPIRYFDSSKITNEYHALLDAMIAHDPAKRLSAKELLRMDLFHTPITSRAVSQHEMVRNNNVMTLRDVKAVRLCNLTIPASHAYVGGSDDSCDSSNYHSLSRMPSSLASHDQMLLEGIGRILDSPFDQIPRLFMILPPMAQDLDPTHPFMPSHLLQNHHLRLVLLCEGLSGYGEDAHVTDHYGYLIDNPSALIQEVGKVLLHLVAVAGTNNPGYETPQLDQPLTLTGTPLDNCQRWYPSLRSYYETLQASILQQIGGNPNLNELRKLREPTLKYLERWLAATRRQYPLVGHAPRSAPIQANGGGGGGLQSGLIDDSVLVEEVTGPGGGEGYGGLYKMPVGTCGHRWICRGCVSRLMSM